MHYERYIPKTVKSHCAHIQNSGESKPLCERQHVDVTVASANNKATMKLSRQPSASHYQGTVALSQLGVEAGHTINIMYGYGYMQTLKTLMIK